MGHECLGYCLWIKLWLLRDPNPLLNFWVKISPTSGTLRQPPAGHQSVGMRPGGPPRWVTSSPVRNQRRTRLQPSEQVRSTSSDTRRINPTFVTLFWEGRNFPPKDIYLVGWCPGMMTLKIFFHFHCVIQNQ